MNNSAEQFLMSIDPRNEMGCETSKASSSRPSSDSSKAPALPTTSARLAEILKALTTGIRSVGQAVLRILRGSAAKHCGPTLPTHRVLMYFSRLNGYWYCAFFDDHNMRTRLPRRLKFRDPSKIWEMAKRGNAELKGAASPEEINRAIELGCGKIWLQLSDEQRATLG